ncbi:MAG: outer membrane beta-barrel protein [Terriglobia bacterium]
MHPRTLVKALMPVLVLCLGTVVLDAQGYNVFLMGGGSSLFNSNSSVISTGPLSSSYATGGQFTVGGQVPLNGLLSVEGAYGWGQNNLLVTSFGGFKTSYGIRNQRISGDLVLHPPVSILGLLPYVDAGPEYDRFSPYGSAVISLPGFSASGTQVLSTDNKIGFNYGGGVEIKFLPFIGLRLDVRDHVTSSPSFGLPGRYSSTAHDLEYSAGLVFNFGK